MKRGENCTRAHPFRPFTQPLGPAVTKPVHFFIPVSVSLHLLFDVAQKEFVVKLAHTHTQQAFPACSVLTNQQSQTILRCVPPFARYRAACSLLCRLFFNKSATHANKKRTPSAKECERAALFCHRSARLASIAFHSCLPRPFYHFSPLQKAGLVDGSVRACALCTELKFNIFSRYIKPVALAHFYGQERKREKGA
jgi:hypothetical protein